MPFKPPQKIKITSCGSILELDQVLPKNNTRPEPVYVYKYKKSMALKGKTVEYKEEYITKQLTNYFRDVS